MLQEFFLHAYRETGARFSTQTNREGIYVSATLRSPNWVSRQSWCVRRWTATQHRHQAVAVCLQLGFGDTGLTNQSPNETENVMLPLRHLAECADILDDLKDLFIRQSIGK